LKIAKALEGASHEIITGTVAMREDNHQLLQLYVSTFRKMGTAGVKYDAALDCGGYVPGGEAVRGQ
jgi:hypothetical protein